MLSLWRPWFPLSLKMWCLSQTLMSNPLEPTKSHPFFHPQYLFAVCQGNLLLPRKLYPYFQLWSVYAICQGAFFRSYQCQQLEDPPLVFAKLWLKNLGILCAFLRISLYCRVIKLFSQFGWHCLGRQVNVEFVTVLIRPKKYFFSVTRPT